VTEPTVDRERQAELAADFSRLHTDPELLVLVNVWDVASAEAVAAAPGCRALATASAAVAAAYGYPDHEQIPLELMLDQLARIAAAVDLPLTADLEAGYGDPADTVRRAFAAGAVGANLEDRLRPRAEAVAAVQAATAAIAELGIPFVLNARTDTYLLGGDRHPDVVLSDTLDRGRAFLEAGAACVFVPGRLSADVIATLVDGFGRGRLSLLGMPGLPRPADLEAVGVARISYGPYPQRRLLAGLTDLAGRLHAGERFPILDVHA
jgi:2-methylisocitrate lyase-like PEP mutase family enzyme